MTDLLLIVEQAAKAVSHVASFVADSISERRNAFNEGEAGDWLDFVNADRGGSYTTQSSSAPPPGGDESPATDPSPQRPSPGTPTSAAGATPRTHPAAVSAHKQAAAHPAGPDFVDWAAEAIKDVLADHQLRTSMICESADGFEHDYVIDGMGWRDHVAPLIAKRLESAGAQRKPSFEQMAAMFFPPK